RPPASRAAVAWGCARARACPSRHDRAILGGAASDSPGGLNLMPLDRNHAVPALVGNPADFLMIAGLAGTAYELAAITNDGDNLFALGGAMGAALSMGLGLALAQPKRRVLVATGDGELLMNVSTLATVGALQPPNLSI